jgi:hypothetical protein
VPYPFKLLLVSPMTIYKNKMLLLFIYQTLAQSEILLDPH